MTASSALSFPSLSLDRIATPPPSDAAPHQQMENEYKTPSKKHTQSRSQGGPDSGGRRFGTAITNAPHNSTTPLDLVPTPLSECPRSTVHTDGPYFGAVFGDDAVSRGTGCLTYTNIVDEEAMVSNDDRMHEMDSPKAINAPPPTPFCDQRSAVTHGNDESQWLPLVDSDVHIDSSPLGQQPNASARPIARTFSPRETCVPKPCSAINAAGDDDNVAILPPHIAATSLEKHDQPTHPQQRHPPTLQASFLCQLTNSLRQVSERDANTVASETGS